MKTLIEIGGIGIAVYVPEVFGNSLFSDAYTPFGRRPEDVLVVKGNLRVKEIYIDNVSPDVNHSKVVATGFNDLGESRLYYDGNSYTVGITPGPGMKMRFMRFDPGFCSATLSLMPGDIWNSFILDSMLRILFSQVAVRNSSFLIHASAVETSAGVHIFMGRSGTGKSTHSSLWLRNFADCSLLNDDNPLVKLNPDGTASVAGTPWSGKTRCWRASERPLLSMTRLCQSSENRYIPMSDIDAFVTVMPGVSVIVHSRQLYDCACIAIGRIVGIVKIGMLECRPDNDAAQVCYDNVTI